MRPGDLERVESGEGIESQLTAMVYDLWGGRVPRCQMCGRKTEKLFLVKGKRVCDKCQSKVG